MTAVDVSAIRRSNVERPTPDVQSKRDRRGLTQRFSYDFAPASSAWLRTGFTKSPRRLHPAVSRDPMTEVSDQFCAAALARARSLQAARKAFISAASRTIRLATPLYFFVIPVTVRVTAPWWTRP